MPDINVGLIGAGAVGRAHALALENVMLTFGPRPAAPRLVSVFGDSNETTTALARDFAIAQTSDDWRDIVRDPSIHLVDIAISDERQGEIARAAISHGKHILCEFSPSLTVADMQGIADAAETAGLRAGVCFPYLRNPVQTLAKKLISTGELGAVTGFRATFDREMASAEAVVLGSLGAHLIALGLHLIGPVARVCGASKTFGGGSVGGAWDGDFIQFLCEFENGAVAHFSAGRMATGRMLGLTYEAQGPLAAICFNQERMNELDLFRQAEPLEVRGYKTIYSGPDQPDYAAFHPLPGVGLSFNDQRTFEARAIVMAIHESRAPDYDFRFAEQVGRVQRAVSHSVEKRGWAGLREVA